MNKLFELLGGKDRLSWRRPFFGLLFHVSAMWLLVHEYLTGDQFLAFVIPLMFTILAAEAIPAAMKNQRPAPSTPLE